MKPRAEASGHAPHKNHRRTERERRHTDCYASQSADPPVSTGGFLITTSTTSADATRVNEAASGSERTRTTQKSSPHQSARPDLHPWRLVICRNSIAWCSRHDRHHCMRNHHAQETFCVRTIFPVAPILPRPSGDPVAVPSTRKRLLDACTVLGSIHPKHVSHEDWRLSCWYCPGSRTSGFGLASRWW